MIDFSDGLRFFWKKLWKKYRVELVLILFSLIISLTSLTIFLYSSSPAPEEIKLEKDATAGKTVSAKIYVDVSGAVNHPDVYQLSYGARLKDALKMAGGISDQAEQIFFRRNFNLARIINDQEKIYIPSLWEINAGLFTEPVKTFDYFLPKPIDQNTIKADHSINVNQALTEELDTLPGVGQATAEKIINGRPYATIDELVSRKIINKNVFEKIRELITVN